MALTFFIHALCAVGYCLPRYEAPGSDSSAYVANQLRSGEETLPNSPIVQLSDPEETFRGVQGTLMTTIKGRPLAAFMGIPYAQPPVANLRFSAPQPVSPWEGIRVTNQTSPVCLQLDAAQYFYVYGREDCLYLNVYTPKLPTRSSTHPKLPVIVYIHGGAFLFGGGSDLGPSYLLDQDVILVTFNYRLGVLGFLSTGDETCPGNNGLKDQAMALRWVADNIEKFGGDKERITFMGQSAGATSVNLHLMSNQTKGLDQSFG
jgi:carboxylesterase type B